MTFTNMTYWLSCGKNLIMRFHHDEDGILFLTIPSIVVILAVAALPMNTGLLTAHQIKNIEAVNAAVQAETATIARGMNLLSTINVVQTELFAFTLVLRGLKQTWEDGKNQAKSILRWRWGCSLLGPFIGGGCKAYMEAVRAAKEYFEVHLNLYGKLIEEMTKPKGGLLWHFMDFISATSDIVPPAFSGMAWIAAQEFAEHNGVDGIALYPVFPEMPVKRGDSSDLCHPTKIGSPSKYPLELQRGYFHLLTRFYSEHDKGPLLVYRDKAGFIVQDIAFGLMFRASPLNRNTDREFQQFCQESPLGDYQSPVITPRRLPRPFLLEGARRSTTHSAKALSSVKHELNYLGVTWTQTAPLFMPTYFRNPRDRLCAYAQARVYNTISFDLFSPAWSAKPVMADLLETDPLSLVALAEGCESDENLAAAAVLNAH